jgi:hypothetical protein
MAFKVAYLSLIAYLQQDKNLPSEYLFDSLKDFIHLKLTDISFNEANYKYLYSCLSFINLLFLMPTSSTNQSKPTANSTNPYNDPLAIRSSRGRSTYASFAGGKGLYGIGGRGYKGQFVPSGMLGDNSERHEYQEKTSRAKVQGGVF